MLFFPLSSSKLCCQAGMLCLHLLFTSTALVMFFLVKSFLQACTVPLQPVQLLLLLHLSASHCLCLFSRSPHLLISETASISLAEVLVDTAMRPPHHILSPEEPPSACLDQVCNLHCKRQGSIHFRKVQLHQFSGH